MHGLPASLRVYILGLAALTALVLAWSVYVWRPAWTASDAILPFLLGILVALAYQFPLKLSDKVELRLYTAAVFAAALLFDVPTAMLVTILAAGLSELSRRTPMADVLFNSSQTGLQVVAGSTVYHHLTVAAAGAAPTLAIQSAAVGLAAVAMYSVNALAVYTAVGLQKGVNPFTLWRSQWRSGVLEEAALYLLGVVMVANGAQSPWLLLLAAAPNVFVYLALQSSIERRRQAAEIERLKEFNERIVQGMEEGILIYDRAGRITFVNPRMEEMLGRGSAELIGQHWSKLVPGVFVERLDAELQHASQGARIRRETVLLRQNGIEIPVIVSATPMVEQGEPRGVLCVLTDITDQKQMEQQLLQVEKLSAMGELVAGVAHELNNPLTTVLGFAQLLKLDAAAELKNDLETISQAAERCARIVQNLLTFARQRKPGKISVDLNQVINETLSLKTHQLNLDNIRVVRELAPQLPWVVADPFQIQQVVLNLVNNAQYAMAHANGGGQLLIRTRRSDSQVTIEVTDAGPGMPPEVMNRIFDPFFTTKGHDGTGLGLSVSYGIVRDHGGHIRVSSVPGRGASFYVELPIGTGAPRRAPQSMQPNDNGTGPGMRVLVVDDEEHILALIRRVLQAEKHRVEVAADGAMALEMIARESYDLMLIDLRMPGINGRMLYERLSTMRPELVQRVIFITGELVSPESQAFIRLTGCPLIRKPFALDELRQVVEDMLNHHGS